MKKIYRYFFIPLIVLACTACSISTPTDNEINNSESATSSKSAYISTSSNLTSEKLENAKEQYLKTINEIAINKKHINKICLKTGSDFCSSDRSVINQWIDLLHDMELTAEPWETVYGSEYRLSVTLASEDIHLGTFYGSRFAPDDTKDIMFRITNYMELYDRFLESQKAIVRSY